jgi:hypothetical protein
MRGGRGSGADGVTLTASSRRAARPDRGSFKLTGCGESKLGEAAGMLRPRIDGLVSEGSRSVESWRDRSDKLRCVWGEAGADVVGVLSRVVSKPSIFTNCADFGMLVVAQSGRAALEALAVALATTLKPFPSTGVLLRAPKERL